MQAWEDKFDRKLDTIVSTINLNTQKYMEVATDTLNVQTANIAPAMGTMTMEFPLSNQLLQAIEQSLVATFPSLPAHNHSNSHPPMHNGQTLPQLQTVQVFTTHHQPTIITKATTYTMNSSLIGLHQWLILLAFVLSISIKSTST
jgi:hypothetical protein